MNNILKIVLNIVFFVIGISLVIFGQRNVGIQGLLVMLLGLSIMIVQLYLYNRKYQ